MRHTYALLLAPLLLAALTLAACTGPQRTTRPADPGATVVRVATFNLNYGLAGDEATLDALGGLDADVVALQETTPAWEEVIRERFEGKWPHMTFVHSSGAGGIAVLSRHPLLAEQTIDPPSPPGWFPALRVEVDTPGQPIQVVAVHLRPPYSDSGSIVVGYFEASDYHDAEIQALTPQLRDDLPTVVLGDFNEGDGGAAIGWLEARGFENALPAFGVDGNTWRWNTSVGEVTSRLDHVVYDRRFVPLDAGIVAKGRSDHLPVVATLQLGQAAE